jgi:hypothetical protein
MPQRQSFMRKIAHSGREWQGPGKLIESGKQRLRELWMKDVQPAMQGLTFFCKHKSLFMPRKKHSHRVGSCRVRYSIDPDCYIPGVNHYQLEVALTTWTKGSTRGIGYFADAHLFRPEAFTIDHLERAVSPYMLISNRAIDGVRQFFRVRTTMKHQVSLAQRRDVFRLSLEGDGGMSISVYSLFA